MKSLFFLPLLLLLLLASCQNDSQSSEESAEIPELNKQVANKFFYVEFLNLDSTNKANNTIEQVKKELYNSGYIAQKGLDNDWQGIRKVDTTEHIELHNLEESHPNIHRFIAIADYDVSKGDLEKIVITLNIPLNDTIPNFNYHSYKKRGHDDWQSATNPGDFRYLEGNPFNDSDVSNWMIRTIVLLTFK